MNTIDPYLERVLRAQTALKQLGHVDVKHTRSVVAVLVVGDRTGSELKQEVATMLPRSEELAVPMLLSAFRKIHAERPAVFAHAMAAIAPEVMRKGGPSLA